MLLSELWLLTIILEPETMYFGVLVVLRSCCNACGCMSVVVLCDGEASARTGTGIGLLALPALTISFPML